MRKIQFRGKRLDNGEWVYGDLLQIAGGCLIYFGSKVETGPDIPESSNVAVELMNCEIAVVDPSTVGQLTENKDKDGKTIAEGDLVESYDEIYPIVFKESCFGYQGRFEFLPLCHIDTNEDMIIGNIHDNPELLHK